MKTTIETKQLLQALSYLTSVIRNKSILPILEYTHVNIISDTEIKIRMTDLENTISITIPHNINNNNESLKEFIFNPFSIVKLLKTTDSKEIMLEHKSGILTIYDGLKDTYSFDASIDPKEFPTLSLLTDKISITLKLDELINTLLSLSYYVSNNTSDNEMFKSISLKGYTNDAFISLVATDRHILSKRIIEINDALIQDIDIIIPKKFIDCLTKLNKSSDKDTQLILCTLKDEEDILNIRMTIDNVSITSRLVDGKYINYNGVFPTSNSCDVKIQKPDIINALSKINTLITERTPSVTLLLLTDSIKLSYIDTDTNIEGTVTIPAKISGTLNEIEISNEIVENKKLTHYSDEQIIFFDPILLLKTIKHHPGEVLHFYLENCKRAMTIKKDVDDKNVSLICPMKITESKITRTEVKDVVLDKQEDI